MPLVADLLTFDEYNTNPGDTTHYAFNRELYTSSLLSFVTESEFNQTGAFITEKTYKALASGHPIITLNGSGALRALRELGFRTDWTMINNYYDDVVDHKKRFHLAHQELFNWCSLSREEQHEEITKSRDVLIHNRLRIRELALSTNTNYPTLEHINMQILEKCINELMRKDYSH